MKELNSYLKEKFIVFEVNVFIVNIQNDVDPDGIEEVGIIEIVEKDGNKYIVSSSTPNDDEASNTEIIFKNLLEFNNLNQLTPIEL